MPLQVLIFMSVILKRSYPIFLDYMLAQLCCIKLKQTVQLHVFYY